MSAKSATRKPAAAKTPPKSPEKNAKTAKSGGGTRSAILIGIVGLVVVAAVVGFLFWQRSDPEVFASGNEPGLVTKVESLYNDIYVYQAGRTGTTCSPSAPSGSATSNSIVNPKDELDLPVYYTQSMTAGLAYAAGLDDAAIIGLGGGRTAWYHHKSVPGAAH